MIDQIALEQMRHDTRLKQLELVERNRRNQEAWARAVSALLALPALRACWPMSSVDYAVATRARDIAGSGYHLNSVNTVTFGADAAAVDSLPPVANLASASSQYLYRADGGAANWADIIGTETFITATQRGLTLGCWVNQTTLPGTAAVLMDKMLPDTNNRSYGLYYLAASSFTLGISLNGIALVTVTSTTGAALTAQWYFVAGRFVPSTTQDTYVGTARGVYVKTTNAVGIPASIFDGTADFSIGANFSGGAYTNFLNGKISLAWLCASALSDNTISAIFQQQRALFGV